MYVCPKEGLRRCSTTCQSQLLTVVVLSVRVRGVHCTSNFSLMISKIEAPAADDAPF